MRLKIASRKSDLAKIQAYQVADALRAKNHSLEIEFYFRESLGDINQTDPLWKMPERGVFTEDFVNDLETEACDLVVHSWKDLPTEPRKNTKIVATLARADMRDVLLFRKDQLAKIRDVVDPELKILTSSPRRAYNLSPFLREHLPFVPSEIDFLSVRGNVPTRMKKLMSEDVDGLVVAKAALDRLLNSTQEEFSQTRSLMRDILDACEFMVLPLSANPTAAAQGALAIEIKSSRAELELICKSVHCQATYDSVVLEREILSGYGGGCHQKIGVSVLQKEYGNVLFLRGLTDQGEILRKAELSRAKEVSKVTASALWPTDPQESFFFNREAVVIKKSEIDKADLIWIARANAWPEGLDLLGKIIWSAGLQTWKKLAARGIWVHGSADGLGESEPTLVETLVGKTLSSAKLSHVDAPQVNGSKTVATYKLVPKASAGLIAEQFEGKTHFFWMSGTSFDEAIKHHPEIKSANHACGPGHTYSHLREVLGSTGKIEIYLSYDDWKNSLIGGE